MDFVFFKKAFFFLRVILPVPVCLDNFVVSKNIRFKEGRTYVEFILVFGGYMNFFHSSVMLSLTNPLQSSLSLSIDLSCLP